MPDKTFTVFVTYTMIIPSETEGDVPFFKRANTFITVEVNKSETGYIPFTLTPYMIAQIRGHIAVTEEGDEAEIIIDNLVIVDGHQEPTSDQENGTSDLTELGG